MPADPRLEVLEEAIRRLAREVDRLSREVQSLRTKAAPDAMAPPVTASPTATAALAANTSTHEASPSSTNARPPSTIDALPRPVRPSAPPPRTTWQTIGLETLIGRYGALALAALTILLGMGVFLSWAVEHVELGPRVRVLLGASAALGVAAVGVALRGRGARRFGNALLGLALAITHVVAWGAGPFLNVVSPTTAFIGAALASAALAALAWWEREETLFSVGTGGALLAPFVTADGNAPTFQLLGFGVLVLGTGMLAIRDRSWRTAARIVIAGATLYVVVALQSIAYGIPAERVAPAAFALLCAWVALAVTAPPHRLRIGRAMTALAIMALLVPALARTGALMPELIAGALVATVTTHLLLHRARGFPEAELATIAVLYPLAALAAAILALADISSALAVGLAVLWAGMAAIGALALPTTSRDETWVRDTGAPGPEAGRRHASASLHALASPHAPTSPSAPASLHARAAPRRSPSFRDPAGIRDAHWLVVALAGATSVVLALHPWPQWCVLGLGAWGLGLALSDRRLRSRGLAVGISAVLSVASMWGFSLLVERDPYRYTPFLTGESAAAAVVLAGWWAFTVVRWLRTVTPVTPESPAPDSHALPFVASALTIGWGYLELARAFSPDLATFLVIIYLASVGIAIILIGRARRVPAARHSGLALAIVAGVKALLQASTLAFGLRLSSYLIVGAFLLGVAYLYRAASDTGTEVV